MNLVHPLAKVIGQGSAKSGVHHWWAQRLTAIALVPLTLWVVFGLYALAGADYGTVQAWVADPWHAALLIAWVLAMLHHAQLGLQVVIEDYVHVPWAEITLHILIKFAAILGMIVAVLSIARVVLGGSQ